MCMHNILEKTHIDISDLSIYLSIYLYISFDLMCVMLIKLKS